MDSIETATRAALERVIRDPGAKPADIVRAAELLRGLGDLGTAGGDLLAASDADLLRMARGEGGTPPKKGTHAAATDSGPIRANEGVPGRPALPTGNGAGPKKRGRPPKAGGTPRKGTQNGPNGSGQPPGAPLAPLVRRDSGFTVERQEGAYGASHEDIDPLS